MSELIECPLCGNAGVRRITEERTVDHHGMAVTFTDTADKCPDPSCGETFYDYELSTAHTRAFARALFLQHGVKFGRPEVRARLEAAGIFADA